MEDAIQGQSVEISLAVTEVMKDTIKVQCSSFQYNLMTPISTLLIDTPYESTEVMKDNIKV